MPRYFFDIEAEQLHRDLEGACLPDDESSRQFAAGLSDVISSGTEAPRRVTVRIRTLDGALIDVLRRDRNPFQV